MTTWKQLIHEERREDDGPLVEVSPNEEVLDVEFDAGYGAPEGPHFLAWSETRVYFPVVYDGAESVGSAPRNPPAEPQEHVGSW